MPAVSAVPSFPTRPRRVSLLSEVGIVELLTVRRRTAERLFDLSEGGVGVLTQDPLPEGTLVLAVLALPGAGRIHDVIVRVAWAAERSMGLEFVLPDDEMVESIRRLRRDLEHQ